MFPYITADELRDHLAKENINHDGQLGLIRRNVSSAVERRCGRVFRVVSDQQRRAVIDSQGRIPLIDLIEATEILIDMHGNSSYLYTVDLNAVDYLPDAQENGEPALRYDYAVARPSGGAEGYFTCGSRVKVTGSWGFVETRVAENDEEVDVEDMPPPGLAYACLMLAARYYKRKDTPLAVAQMPGFGFKRLIDEDKDVRDHLEPFIHHRLRRVIQ